MVHPSWEDFQEYLREQDRVNPINNSETPEEEKNRINRLLEMFPESRIKKIMKREAKKYKLALDKKWRHWLLSVSK